MAAPAPAAASTNPFGEQVPKAAADSGTVTERTVTLDARKKAGLTISAARTVFTGGVVTDVVRGGQADLAGIKVGEEVVDCNGLSLIGL